MKLFLALLVVVSAVALTDAKRYRVLTGPTLSRAQWNQRCARLGGRLANINNAHEQRLATAAIKRSSKPYILTAIKRRVPHSRTFVNGFGRLQRYFNWRPSRRGWRNPDDCRRCGKHGEPCVMLYKNNGQWNDLRCYLNAALCEFGRRRPRPTIIWRRKTFFVINANRWLNRGQLAHLCRRRGAQLGRINNGHEQRVAAHLIRRYSNSGATLTGMFRKYRLRNSRRYKHWNRGEPNNWGRGGEPCVEVYKSGKWNDIKCRGRSVLCQRVRGKRPRPRPRPRWRYVWRWRTVVRKTFFVVNANRWLSRGHLAGLCRRRRGHLATINNGHEQRVAYHLIRRFSRSHSALTGMRRAHRLPRSRRYKFWNRGEPNNCCGGEPCVEVYKSSGRWNDIKCRGRTALCAITGRRRVRYRVRLSWRQWIIWRRRMKVKWIVHRRR